MTQPKILIVDDEPFNVDYLEQELEELNYKTISACNGQEALEKIQAESPDLVLLDIMMPVMDGFAVLARMKVDPGLRNIPVIVISAMNDLQSIVKGIEQGAEDYLPKPFEPVLLHARISSCLEKKRLRDEHRRLIRTFADKEVAEELMSKGFSLGGKRTHITAMFTDIRNFTTITEANDPADVIDLINQYYLIVIEIVQVHGGNVNQLQGDGLMSFFGAPVFYPDHAQRAVRSALEIRRQLAAFNSEQAKKNGVQIEMGVGIATGQVVAGYAGTQSRATYLCVGDTVNLSARLESHTKNVKRPIVIDENTRKELDTSIQVDPLGEEIFKGKTIPVKVYSVMTKS
jgi:class 3 adenylate cyclase/CheY-like chemotaxis protein